MDERLEEVQTEEVETKTQEILETKKSKIEKKKAKFEKKQQKLDAAIAQKEAMIEDKLLKGLSDNAKMNKTALICYVIVNVILTVAYLLEVIKGNRTVPYFALVAALLIIPIIIAEIVYKKNKDTNVLKMIMAVFYMIFYAFAMFTTVSQFPFVYILPMYMIIMLFSDVKLGSWVCSIGFVVNILQVIKVALTTGYTKEQTADVEIQLVLMALLGVLIVINSKTTTKINEGKLRRLQQEQDKTSKLLEAVMNASGDITEGIEKVNEKMSTLGISVEEIREAMIEVSRGTAETAESVQAQLVGTEAIQNQIGMVREAGDNIADNMKKSSTVIDAANKNMDNLFDQIKKSEEANGTVMNDMHQLNEHTDKMNTIIELINSVANRTSMLALNAGIEAARAGEAGKGFAVVASEISNLANQTKQATVGITKIIDNIVTELSEVVQAVDLLNEANQLQGEAAGEVKDSFDKMSQSAVEVENSNKQLGEIIEKLAAENEKIVESIQTISAITEEVSAHSNETCDSSETNSQIVKEVSSLVEMLNQKAIELKSAQE